jgi:Flp pilus assembly protein TadG
MNRPATSSRFTDNSPPKVDRRLLRQQDGSAILEFAIALPLLVVFVVGIYDFGGAFNQKQKIEQAVQEAAIIAAAQPTSDLQSKNPDSLQPVVTAVDNSLGGSGVLDSASCSAPKLFPPNPPPLTWTYQISGCSSLYPQDNLVITINRGWTAAISQSGQSGLYAVCTVVKVQYPYHWSFNSAIQLLIPGANYAAPTLSESATVHNQT